MHDAQGSALSGSTQIPVWYCVQLGHAAAQWVAHEAGIDILHIKGAAIDPTLRSPEQERPVDGLAEEPWGPRGSTDADVLVRPDQAPALLDALISRGWRVVTDFETGSAFRHASSLWHPHLGHLDVHRHFPGIGLDAEKAFELMWADRHTIEIAHRTCDVPSVAAQRVLLLLHTARGGRLSDREWAWERADALQRREAEALVATLRAEVAFAAAMGGLDRFADAPEHDLWALYSSSRDLPRWAEWRARFRAARGVRGKAGVLASMLRVNRGHLEMELGRQPSRRDLRRASWRRIGRALSGVWGSGR